MSDLLMEGSHTLISLAIGGLAGYCVAYVTGLKAVRKGDVYKRQEILSAT